MQEEIIQRVEKERAEKKLENRLHKHAMYYRISMAVIALALFVVAYVCYLAFYPFKMADYQTTPLQVLNEGHIVKQGEVVHYQLQYCRYTDKQARITREIHDGIVYTLPELYSRFDKGCHTVEVAREEIPKSVPPGKYRLFFSVEFRVNALQTQTKTLISEEFTVVK